MEKKQKSLKWLNIFLLVINLSAFATFLYMNQSSNSDTELTDVYKSDEYLKQRLNLSDDQFEQIIAMDQKVFRNYQVLIDIQCETNFELIKELSSPNVSEEKMKELTQKLGTYHTAIKRQTVKHFENIREVCNTAQQELLNNFLLEMMNAGDQCQYCNKEDCSRRKMLEEN